MIRQVFEEFEAPREGTVYSDPSTAHLAETFDRPGAVLWVALEQGEPVGCCGIYPTAGLPNGTAELVKFYLAPLYRGQGVGKVLMARSVESAKDMGYKHLYIESTPEFEKAVLIYQNMGFQPLTEPLGKSGHHGCTLYYHRTL